jgi:hypothetical protein
VAGLMHNARQLSSASGAADFKYLPCFCLMHMVCSTAQLLVVDFFRAILLPIGQDEALRKPYRTSRTLKVDKVGRTRRGKGRK